MSLLQIAEPNQSKQPHQHHYGIGIDLGTTRSLVAVVRSSQASVICNRMLYTDATLSDGINTTKHHLNTTDAAPTQLPPTQTLTPLDCQSKLLPSVVYYGKQETLVGRHALAMAKIDPANTISSVKRFMGRTKADIRFNHPYQLLGDDGHMPAMLTHQGRKSPVEVSADILSVLKQRAEHALPKDSIQGAVITVPAYFDEAQRQATKDAAKLAGINVLRLLNEPTAAAFAYGLDRINTHEQQYYLIYDLGGGTFDVSILKLNDGIFEVLATGGHSGLGGDDIDRLIANWLLQQAGLNANDVSNDEKQKLNLLARDYKEQLTNKDSITVSYHNWQGELNNTLLKQLIKPIIDITIMICQRVLRDAKQAVNQHTDQTGFYLNEVVLVGGSTRMPVINQAVAAFFECEPLCRLNPDEVVALGAAKLAEQLINKDTTNAKNLLLDVTPLSLGLETMGGLVEVIIPRNTPIPVKKQQTFTTYQDGQTGMVIHVLQGERDLVADCRSLGKFVLQDIPAMKAGIARIEVTFSIDANGQLSVTAKELTTGQYSDIKIEPAYGLSEDDTLRLLQDGFSHAQKDQQQRMLIEMKVDAKRELDALHAALQEFAHVVSTTATANLTTAMQQVKTALQQSDISTLETAMNQLKPLSDNLAANIMNASVKASLSGTKADDWTTN